MAGIAIDVKLGRCGAVALTPLDILSESAAISRIADRIEEAVAEANADGTIPCAGVDAAGNRCLELFQLGLIPPTEPIEQATPPARRLAGLTAGAAIAGECVSQLGLAAISAAASHGFALLLKL